MRMRDLGSQGLNSCTLKLSASLKKAEGISVLPQQTN